MDAAPACAGAACAASSASAPAPFAGSEWRAEGTGPPAFALLRSWRFPSRQWKWPGSTSGLPGEEGWDTAPNDPERTCRRSLSHGFGARGFTPETAVDMTAGARGALCRSDHALPYSLRKSDSILPG